MIILKVNIWGYLKLIHIHGKELNNIFLNIKNLDKIDITGLFQLILKKICNIYVKNYKKKWFEIDNVKDYKIFLNQTYLNS